MRQSKLKGIAQRQVLHTGLCSILLACGTWVGNPKEDDDNPDGVTQEPGTVWAEKGEALLHLLQVRPGEPASISYKLDAGANLLETQGQPFEISLVDSSGREQVYTRSGTGENVLSFTPETEGEYAVLIKNNAPSALNVTIEASEGLAESTELSNATSGSQSPYKDIVLKAVITFARQCKQNTNGGSSSATFTAPEGSYYVQPFVFMGKVDGETKRVTPLSSAEISLVSGSSTIALKKIGDLDIATYREISGLSKDQHEVYTRNFYGAYFGAAGEMYTTDTFRFGGDCQSAPTVALPTDLGSADVQLKVVDASLSPALNASFPVRPSASTSFTMYEKSAQKIDNWDPCSYDNFTAVPKNFNSPELPCRKLAISDPPYITLDYRLPSEEAGAQVTKLSDPTRVLYYGHSLSRAFKKAVIDQQADLRASLSEIKLESCLNNGGLHAVPLNTQKTLLPLGEFNVKSGDLIQLARKTGSYTALKDFYQGDVQAAGDIEFASCIPDSSTQTACASYKVLKVQVSSCSIKADSGVSASSVTDSFIYPSYYELSGEITD